MITLNLITISTSRKLFLIWKTWFCHEYVWHVFPAEVWTQMLLNNFYIRKVLDFCELNPRGVSSDSDSHIFEDKVGILIVSDFGE
jgi:hypothetical protein